MGWLTRGVAMDCGAIKGNSRTMAMTAVWAVRESNMAQPLRVWPLAAESSMALSNIECLQVR